MDFTFCVGFWIDSRRVATVVLGGRRHDVRHEHDAAGRGAELLRRGVDGEAGGGEAERNRGGGNRRPPGRGAWKRSEDASDNEPNFVLARGLHAVGDL